MVNYDEITARVATIRKKYDTRNLFELCRQMGIRVILHETSLSVAAFKGFSMIKSRIPVILLNAAMNEEMTRVVLAHEMGHGQKDHPAKGARRSLNMQILGAATGSQAGLIMATVINNRHITKPMEREADALAFDYISHAGCNPGACAAVWQRVMDMSKSQPSSFEQFLSDHPANDDRRDAYAKKLNQYSNGHVTNNDGVIKVNTTVFCTPAAAAGMSAKERAYFVMGNLAAAYHNGHNKQNAYASGNTVMLGPQPIITCASGDESAGTLAERLNKIK